MLLFSLPVLSFLPSSVCDYDIISSTTSDPSLVFYYHHGAFLPSVPPVLFNPSPLCVDGQIFCLFLQIKAKLKVAFNNDVMSYNSSDSSSSVVDTIQQSVSGRAFCFFLPNGVALIRVTVV